MATKKFGNVSFNTDNGLAFRFKDGKIHRLFGRKNSDDEDAYEEQDYENGYADNDGFEEDERYDDYQDNGYEDGGYGEDYTDDGYADETDDDGYGDEDYEDSYSDRDADPYEDDVDSEGGFSLGILDESDTLNYILLFLLPPLGIWLLWRRGRFDGNKPIKYGLTAASAVWFVILLILLFSAIFGGSGDTTVSGNITMTTPAPTTIVTVTATPGTSGLTIQDVEDDDASASDEGGDDSIANALALDATPEATALAGANGQVAANSVYMTATGMYYHNNPSCTTLTSDGNSVSTVTTDVAIERGKSPCPQCYPDQKVYYATESGKYYHVDQNCSSMLNATSITKEAAVAKGKKECPVCITGELQSLGKLKYIDSTWTDKSGLYVYATSGGKYFHTEADCSGMKNPQTVSLMSAMMAGKAQCPTCAKTAGTTVWCTKNGKSYHNKQDCSGMEGAYQITLAEALVMGKSRCSSCWAKGNGIFTSNAAAPNSAALGSSGGTVYVYATKGGTYFHTQSNCSGMTGASKITLNQAISAGKTSCPTCCAGADAIAYCTPKGTYYHSEPNCSGMKGATKTTVAQALADGHVRCSVCWGGTTATTGLNTKVYATKGGTYYHVNKTCSGMQNATELTIAQAVKAGKTACPTCASAANSLVYSTDKGKYYHSNKTCSGMHNAKQRTLEQAIILGQSACPTCIGSTSASGITVLGTGKFSKGTASSSSGKSKLSGVSSSKFSKGTSKSSIKISGSGKVYSVSTGTISGSVASSMKVGNSGIKVYATKSGKYYHTSKAHAGSGAVHVALETAIKAGKSACPTCSSLANRTVYAKTGSKYYHFYKAHAGSGARSGKLSYALAMGFEACPTCVKYAKAKAKATSSKTYKAGASGIKVYATITGKYYHVYKSCAGSNAAHVTLETALNYGKKACPTCSSLAKKTVYATKKSKYYHASKSHAGSGAVSGTLAAAMASGMHACPVCILGSEAYEQSDIKYSASADTAIYIDTDSDLAYYHRTSKCSNAAMSNGTRVMLEFVLKWGYKACPYCNPPTSVS